jgi:hypothetical protein
MTQDIIEMANKASKEWLKELPSPEETANPVPKRFLEIFAELAHTRGYMDGWSDSDEAKTSVSFEMITNAAANYAIYCVLLSESFCLSDCSRNV